MVEVRREVVISNADPARPPQRWAIPRDQINGGDELVAGDWIRLRPEDAANVTGNEDPTGELSPSWHRLCYAARRSGLVCLGVAPVLWWLMGALAGSTMLALAVAALAASAALSIADGR